MGLNRENRTVPQENDTKFIVDLGNNIIVHDITICKIANSVCVI